MSRSSDLKKMNFSELKDYLKSLPSENLSMVEEFILKDDLTSSFKSMVFVIRELINELYRTSVDHPSETLKWVQENLDEGINLLEKSGIISSDYASVYKSILINSEAAKFEDTTFFKGGNPEEDFTVLYKSYKPASDIQSIIKGIDQKKKNRLTELINSQGSDILLEDTNNRKDEKNNNAQGYPDLAHLNTNEYRAIYDAFAKVEKRMNDREWDDAVSDMRIAMEGILLQLLTQYVTREDVDRYLKANNIPKGAGAYRRILYDTGIIDSESNSRLLQIKDESNSTHHFDGDGNSSFTESQAKNLYTLLLAESKKFTDKYMREITTENRKKVQDLLNSQQNNNYNNYNKNTQSGSYNNYSSSRAPRRNSAFEAYYTLRIIGSIVGVIIVIALISTNFGSRNYSRTRRTTPTTASSTSSSQNSDNFSGSSSTAASTAQTEKATEKVKETEKETEKVKKFPEYEISIDETKIRKEADKESDKLGQVDVGVTLTGTGKISENEKWAEVFYPDDSSTGWVKLSHLKNDPDTYIVTADNSLNVRESTSADSASIAKLSSGQIVAGTGTVSEDSQWTEIYLPDGTGTTGWVYSSHIQKTEEDNNEGHSDDADASDNIESAEAGEYPSATNSYGLTISVVSISGNHVQLHYDNNNLTESYSLGWVGNSKMTVKTDVKSYEATIDGPFMPEVIDAGTNGEITADFGENIEGTLQSITLNPICRMNGSLPSDPNMSSANNTFTISN